MSVESFDPNANIVKITENAAAHFRQQISKSAEAKAIRLSVKQSGCTGWKYLVDLVNEIPPADIQMDLADGYLFLVDPKALDVVSGVEVDFVTQGVNHNLIFNNPRVKDYCGCGESFSIE